MAQLTRLLRYTRRFLSDARYRNRILDTIERHVEGAAHVDLAPTPERVAEARFLNGRRICLIGGCELTFFGEQLAGYGAEVCHSFEHGRPSDPLGELTTPGSLALSEAWDDYVLSITQVFRGMVQRLQLDGLAYGREEQERDLEAVIGNYRQAIAAIRAHSGAPIFLQTYFLGYRPTYGLHEYRSFTSGLSLIELQHAYRLRLYQLAREHAGVYVFDPDLAVAEAGMREALDPEASDGMYDHPTRAGGKLLAEHMIALLAALDPSLRRIKCAVFDLDGTLWAGVLREDGPGGVSVRETFLNVMEQLEARGILLAICSKNDEVELEHLPGLLGERLYGKIVRKHLGWGPKSEALKEIAGALNIGLDTIAFFDDSEFERAEVKANAPSVLVLGPDRIFSSPNMPEFQPLGQVTPEARARTSKYKEQERRREAQQASGEGYHEFLRSSQLRLALRPVASGEASRVFELLQRSNQLNATLGRTTMDALDAYLADPGRYLLRVARLEDRFGDYGLVGVAACAIREDGLQILELAFSCRCAGRGVEQAMVNHLGEVARSLGARSQYIEFVHGPRNQRMFEILLECGFAPAREVSRADGASVRLCRPLSHGAPLEAPDWLTMAPAA